MSVSLGSIGQIAIPVSSADAAEAFYGGKLGLRRLYRFGELVFFDCGGVRLLLEGNPKDKPIQDSGVCLYLRASPIEVVHAQLEELGVPFVDTPHRVARMPDHELWMTFFRDPDGHLLALMEEKKPA